MQPAILPHEIAYLCIWRWHELAREWSYQLYQVLCGVEAAALFCLLVNQGFWNFCILIVTYCKAWTAAGRLNIGVFNFFYDASFTLALALIIVVERDVDVITPLAHHTIIQPFCIDLWWWFIYEWCRRQSIPPNCRNIRLLLHWEDLVKLWRIIEIHKSAYRDFDQRFWAIEAEEVNDFEFVCILLIELCAL